MRICTSRAPALAHHLDDLGRGRAAHDRIVDQDDPLALEVGAVGVVLEPHAEMADLVGRLDEGAADIMVADDAELERQPRFLRHSRAPPARPNRAPARRCRRRHGFRAPARGRCACAPRRRWCPRRRCRAGRNRCTRRRRTGLSRRPNGFRLRTPPAPMMTISPRLDVAHEIGADDVERAGLRGEDPGIAEPAEHQRPHAQRVAHADHPVLRQRDQRIGALDLAQRVDQPLDDGVLEARRDQVDDDLGVAGRLEQAAAPHQLPAQLVGIGQVAVVADGEAAELEIGEQRLDVAQRHLAGRRVAHMADRSAAPAAARSRPSS